MVERCVTKKINRMLPVKPIFLENRLEFCEGSFTVYFCDVAFRFSFVNLTLNNICDKNRIINITSMKRTNGLNDVNAATYPLKV